MRINLSSFIAFGFSIMTLPLLAGCIGDASEDPEGDAEVDDSADGVTGQVDLAQMKSNIMDRTRYSMSYLANSLGYSWVYGCNAGGVGEGMNKYLTSGLQDSSWDPNGESGCRENTSAKSDVRTHIRYKNWRLNDLGSRVNTAQVTIANERPWQAPSFTYRNPSSSPVTINVGPVSHAITRQVSTTLTHGWNFSLTASYKVGVNLFGTGADVTVGATAGYSGSLAQGTTTVDTFTSTYSPQVTIPARKKAVVTVFLNRQKKTVPLSGTTELLFDVEFDGFLAYRYNAINYFPRNRPQWRQDFGDYNSLYTTIVNSQNNWSWDALRSRGLQQSGHDYQADANWAFGVHHDLFTSDTTRYVGLPRINLISYSGTATLASDHFDYRVTFTNCTSSTC
jgi:Aerolysin toxin